MKTNRRTFLITSLGLAALPFLPTDVSAKELPIPSVTEVFGMNASPELEAHFQKMVRDWDKSSREKKQMWINLYRGDGMVIEGEDPEFVNEIYRTFHQWADFYEARMKL